MTELDMTQGLSKNPKLIGGQDIEELEKFISLLNHYKPITYLEIGSREGHALRYLLDRVPSIRDVTVVDLIGGRWGKRGSGEILKENLRLCNLRRWVFLDGNSRDPDIIYTVSRRRYDVIFIDGDHTYEGVEHDFRVYGGLSNRLVALHDVCAREESRAAGCRNFWISLKDDTNKHRIICSRESNRGIGVYFQCE